MSKALLNLINIITIFTSLDNTNHLHMNYSTEDSAYVRAVNAIKFRPLKVNLKVMTVNG